MDARFLAGASVLKSAVGPLTLWGRKKINKRCYFSRGGAAMKMNIRLVPAVCFLLYACGSGASLEGVYSGENTGFLDQIEFRGNNKAELTFMGMTKEGTYEVEGDRVKINNAGEVTVLRIDEAGCLDGGGILGKYCKVGAAPAARSSEPAATKPAGKSKGLVGNRYTAGPAGDQVTFEFLDERTVSMSAEGNTEQLKYSTKGSKVVIEAIDGQKLTLEQRGDDLEGGPDGMIIVFKKSN